MLQIATSCSTFLQLANCIIQVIISKQTVLVTLAAKGANQELDNYTTQSRAQDHRNFSNISNAIRKSTRLVLMLSMHQNDQLTQTSYTY